MFKSAKQAAWMKHNMPAVYYSRLKKKRTIGARKKPK